MGLTGAGLIATSALANRKPGALRAIRKIPKLNNVTPAKIKDAGYITGSTAGGIGGLGGYNFAAYTNAEGKKRQAVKKSMDNEISPTYGEVGFSKAWEPVARNYTPEGQRRKRNKRQAAAGMGGGAAALVGAAALDEGIAAPKLAEGAKNTRESEQSQGFCSW